MATPSIPVNVHVSTHPCLRAKLSQLRSKDANARETRSLIHEIALILGCEALAKSLRTKSSGTAKTPLDTTYLVETAAPNVALVPILRSGLGMLEALQILLPEPVPVYHLGLFREPSSLQPVEYYNNLPYHRPTSVNPDPFPIPDIAILLDPVIATGGTSSAAIQTLLEWGVKQVILISVLGSNEGVRRAAEENGSESVEIWVGDLDKQVNQRGMITPGLGDVGDRLFLTIGK
ncbi:uracil phosphoribosyltransferase-domain-containing protein [Usnea florida]